jgi:nicotinamidase-related amidase
VAAALLLVDVVKDFLHEDGDRLLASYRERHPALVRALEQARAEGLAVVYASDAAGIWDSDAPRLVRRAIEEGKAGELVEAVAPRAGEAFVLKPGYSAFRETPLVSLLRDLGVEEVVVAGTATEMCVFQTATDAVSAGFDVAVEARACATVDVENERLALGYLERVLGVDVRR